MRADVRDPEGNCVPGDEEQVDQPCGSASASDSNSNGDVKSPKTPVSTLKNQQSAKTIPLSAKATISSNLKTCKCTTKRLKAAARQKKPPEAVKGKRKAGGEDPIQQAIRVLPNNDDEHVSDDDSPPGPSTSSDLDFGYPPSKAVPWATKNYYPLSIYGLHDEIVDCWQWIRPTRLETATRYKVFERVRDLIQAFWAPLPVQVSVFGSLRTRLFLPSSDIDILVECADWKTLTDSQLNKQVMRQTMDFLRHHLDIVSFHPAAFVPILKFSDRDTRLNIDISFNTVQGVKAATYMQQVKTEFPCVEPLLLLLKQYIFQNKMHEAYSGGLSSYGISLMLVNFFTIHYSSLRRVQPESDGVNLGYLLMRFLEVYGHELNYSKVAVDPSCSRYRLRTEYVHPTATSGAATAASAASAAGSDGGSWRGDGGSEAGGAGGAETDADDRASVATSAATAETTESSSTSGAGGVQSRPVLLSVHDPLHQGNEVCRASFNIYAVRALFQSALVQLRAVFVADRPASLVWRRHVYRGTMLGRLLHFSPAQINFRYWLKGFVLSRPEPEQSPANGKAATTGVSTLIYGSILSEPSDLSCLLRIPKAGQKVLEIKRPDEVDEDKEKAVKKEEKREQTAAVVERSEGETRPSSVETEDARRQKTPSSIGGQERQSAGKKEEENTRSSGVESPTPPAPVAKYSYPPAQASPWLTVGRGGRVYTNGGGGQSYQRELRYGNAAHYKNAYYYGSGQPQPVQHSQQQQQQQQQQHRPYNGSYQSKTWERMGAGDSKHFADDRKKSRSTEVLAEEPARPHRELTPQLTSSSSSGSTVTPTTTAAATTATTLSYQRSDSAVSSCSTTVMGTTTASSSSAFSTSASSSVSSPAINGIAAGAPTTSSSTTTATSASASSSRLAAGPPPGFGPNAPRPPPSTTPLSCSASPSGSSSFLSRNRGERTSGRGEVYKPPAARKAAEAAAAAGAAAATTTTTTKDAAKKKEQNGIVGPKQSSSVEPPKTVEEKKGG